MYIPGLNHNILHIFKAFLNVTYDSMVQVLNDQMITNMLSVLMFQRDLHH